MVAKLPPQDYDLKIRFGGGLNTRASEEDISPLEAADGQNFLLDLETKEYRPRAPFDLIGTVPNSAAIRGGGSFLKSDGTVHAFVQAGNTVYEWDGTSFTASPVLDTVNSSAKLRCHWRSHSWALDDLGIITDLSLLETVKKWDGTTWADIVFKSGPSTNFGNFFAKYCNIANERAFFSNVKDTNGESPHMIVGTAESDYTMISVSDKPSSAIAQDDPFFLLTPDLKKINGHVQAFGTNIISSEKGRLFNLAGQSAQDFNFEDFYPNSAASGDESLCYVGTDVIYGRQGRLESVKDITNTGDSEANDLTRHVANIVRGYTGWTIAYNSRLNRVYGFPAGQSEVWVYNTAMAGGDVSQWMRWKTNHSMGFQPTFVMSMLDPSDGLEYVFMGDASGNFYRLEGDGLEGDAGTTNLTTSYLTKLYSAPLDAQAFDIEGYIKYRKDLESNVTLTFQYAGESIFNKSVSVSIPAVGDRNYYAGGRYYSGGFYYSSISGRIARQPFRPPGQGNEFQVKIDVEGVNDFSITEIGLRFKAASA